MIYIPPIEQSDWSECYNHGTNSGVVIKLALSTPWNLHNYAFTEYPALKQTMHNLSSTY